jgi:hypothetical protein
MCNTLLHIEQAGKRMTQWTLGQQNGMIELIEKQELLISFADKLSWDVENNFSALTENHFAGYS